jgi:hypothetical protein
LKEWLFPNVLLTVNTVSLSISGEIGEDPFVQNKAHILAALAWSDSKGQESQSTSVKRPQECTTEQPGDIPMSSDPAFKMMHNPVFCGMASLRCAISMENVSITYANMTCSFVCMSHLYNAAQQLGLLKGHWNSLERAMSAYIGTLFSGEPPSLGPQMLRRFLICLKLPATTFARNSRSQSPKLSDILLKAEEIFEYSEVSIAYTNYINSQRLS